MSFSLPRGFGCSRFLQVKEGLLYLDSIVLQPEIHHVIFAEAIFQDFHLQIAENFALHLLHHCRILKSDPATKLVLAILFLIIQPVAKTGSRRHCQNRKRQSNVSPADPFWWNLKLGAFSDWNPDVVDIFPGSSPQSERCGDVSKLHRTTFRKITCKLLNPNLNSF